VSRERKNYTPEEKVAILKRHLVDKIPVSDLCDELELNLNVFYSWQRQLFENAAAVFQKPRRHAQSQLTTPVAPGSAARSRLAGGSSLSVFGTCRACVTCL